MKECISELATQPLLYTDTISGNQVLRDDLWVNSTLELNDNFDELTTLREQVLRLQLDNAKLKEDYELKIKGSWIDDNAAWIDSDIEESEDNVFSAGISTPYHGAVIQAHGLSEQSALSLISIVFDALSTQPSTTLVEHDENDVYNPFINEGK